MLKNTISSKTIRAYVRGEVEETFMLPSIHFFTKTLIFLVEPHLLREFRSSI